MNDLKAKTINRLQDGGLVEMSGKTSMTSVLFRVAASITLLLLGYWMGGQGLFSGSPSGMNKYALFLYENNEFAVADGRSLVQEYGDWARNLASQEKLIDAEKLSDQELYWLGKTTVQNNTSRMSGYFIFYASDFNEAKQIAQTHPHASYGGGIELRPIDSGN